MRPHRGGSAAQESDDRLEVIGLREKVQALDEVDAVSPLAEYPQVSGEGLGVAGDIDDRLSPNAGEQNP